MTNQSARAARPRLISRFLAEARLGWVDARLIVAMPGRERALRFVAVLLFGQRASYIVPALAGMTSGAARYHSPTLNTALLLAVVFWNVLLAVLVWRRGWFSYGHVAADVAITCGLLVVVNINIRSGYELSAANWAGKFALGSAALVGAVLSLRALLVGLGCTGWSPAGRTTC